MTCIWDSRSQQNKQNGPVSDSSMIVLSSAEQSPAISFIDWQCRVYSVLGGILCPLSPGGEECCPSSDSLVMVAVPSAEQFPAISLRLRDWQCRAYFGWSNALLSSSLRIDECGPSSDALTDYSTSYMLLSTELDACVSCICSMSEYIYSRYGRQNSLNSDGSIVSAEYCGTCLEKRSRLKEPEVPVELNISDMVGVDTAGACKKASISCENIKQGGVSYVARHSQHAIEEKIAPDISKVLDISNRTAFMSQQHDETSMGGRYDYQGSGDVSLGNTSAGSVDSSGDEYTTVKADGSVSERCDIETESDIIVESGIGCESQVDDLVGGMKDKSKVGIFSGKSNASMKYTEISTRPSVTESMTSAKVVSNAKLRRLLARDD